MYRTEKSRSARVAKLAIAAWIASFQLAGCELFVSAEERVARAERALEAGDAGAALVDVKNVLQKDSTNARARLLLARVELVRGDVAAAGAALELVDGRAVPPGQFEPLRWRLMWAQRKFDAIVSGLQASRPGLPEPERMLLLGRSLASLGRNAEARDVLAAGAELRPESGETIAALASATQALGRRDEALAMLLKATAGPANGVHVQSVLGEIYWQAANLPAAESAFRNARALRDPTRSPLDLLIATARLGDVLLAGKKLDAAAQLVAELQKNAPTAGVTLLLGARVAAAQGRLVVAVEELQKLLKVDPENGDIRTMLAGLQLEQGAVEQAAANLQRVLAADSANDSARRMLAQIQMIQGRPQEAEKTLAASPAPTPELALMRARAALAAGDARGALDLLEGVAADDLQTESARLDLAESFIQAGRADRALPLLEGGKSKADERRELLRIVATAAKDRPSAIRELKNYAARLPRDPTRITSAALTLSALGESEPARLLFNDLAAERPADALVRLNLARVEARAGRLDAAEAALKEAARIRPEAGTLVSLAQLAARNGREADAVRWLEDARKLDTKAAAPRALLARYYMARKDDAAGLAVADELVKLQPNQPQARVIAALAAARAKNTKRAQDEIDEALRLAPDSAAVYIGKGEVHEQLGQVEQARAAFRRASSLEPSSQLPSIALARLELAAGNLDAALGAARSTQQSPATRAIGLRLEGDILMLQKRPREAEDAFEKLQSESPTAFGAIAHHRARVAAGIALPEAPLTAWLAKNPGDVAVRLVLAEFWQRGGRRPQAIAEYEAGLRAMPADPVLMNNLAWLYQEIGDARALELARRAYAAAPRNAAIADTLGVILVKTNQIDEGVKILREAVAAAPAATDVRDHLAEALILQGSQEAAR